jgi:hypothetical protein
MANLIHGKQLRPNTLTENLLYVTGTTNPSNGQILSYDSAIGGFDWKDDLVVTGGTYNNTTADITFTNNEGSTFTVDMSTMDLNDTFISGTTWNAGNYNLTLHRNDGTDFTENLAILASDVNVTGGTYDINTGIVTFTTNSGTTFQVTGFTSGMTDSFTTTAYTVGNVLRFDNNVYGTNLYNVDLSAFAVDTYVTGGTYSNATGDITYTMNDATTFTVDLSTMDLNDTFTTGTTLVGSTLYFDTTDALSAYTADLSPLLDDTNFYATGATLIGSTAYFDRTDTLSAFTLDLSALDVNDTFVTGGTVAYVNEAGTATFTMNDATTFQVTGFTDTNITGGTYSNATGDITLTKNDGTTVTVDLSTMDLNDTFTTGTTLIGSTLYFDTTDALSAYTADLSPLLDDTNFYTTGSTIVGTTAYFDRTDTLSAYTLDLSGIQTAVPTTLDKIEAVSGTTSGLNSPTGIFIAATPAADGYVGVSVNGVWYSVGGDPSITDCYFSSNGTLAGARAQADITFGDQLVWNGGASGAGFELDSNDRVDIYYDA